MPGRRRFSFIWLVGVAFIGSLVAMELVLQLGARAISHAGFSRTVRPGEGAVILCVGDSHTYGLPLPERESFPAQLHQKLSEKYGRDTYKVVNLGLPGLNSSFVKRRLERQMLQTNPRLVIVWVGINNLWNVAEMDVGGHDESMVWRRRFQRSRLFRLASIAWFGRVGHQYDLDARGSWFEGELPPSARARGRPRLPNPGPGLERDLIEMGELARALGVPVMFVSYPLASQHEISLVIQRAAGRLGVPVVETSRALAQARADGHSLAALVDDRAGPHPSALLYAYVIDSMAPEVASVLDAWYENGSESFMATPGKVAPSPSEVGLESTGS